jgi:hypothetical protein
VCSLPAQTCSYRDGQVVGTYNTAHGWCDSCTQVSNEAVNRIKACAPLLRVLKTLKEGNLEFLTVDSRTVITEHPNAAVRGDHGTGRTSHNRNMCTCHAS